jgi:hypothetical protein
MAAVIVGLSAAARAEHKTTLAVLPFTGADAKEKNLAEKMRFAVSQKMTNDADFGGGGGGLARWIAWTT